jgi:AcrR family transcriptional regulator
VQQEGLRLAPRRARYERPSVRGPAAVRASLIAAASELFAERGTALVSVREIAECAGVNHGLIHHYFRSKQGLVDATLDELAAHATKSLEHGLDLSPDGPLARYLLVASRVLLDSDPSDQAEEAMTAGGMSAVLRRLAELTPDTPDTPATRAPARTATGSVAAIDTDAGASRPLSSRYRSRLRAVQLAALLIGLLLFEPLLVDSAGLGDEDPAGVRAELLAGWAE